MVVLCALLLAEQRGLHSIALPWREARGPLTDRSGRAADRTRECADSAEALHGVELRRADDLGIVLVLLLLLLLLLG